MKRLLALLCAAFMLATILPARFAAAEASRSAEVSTEDDISVNSLTPSYTPSSYYQESEYYDRLCSVALSGNYRNDIINVALSQVGYHEGNSFSELDGGNQSGTGNYSEAGYWFGTEVKGNTYGHFYDWCAMFVSWCARQAGISTNIISNAAYARPDGSSSSGGYSYFHVDPHSPDSYSPAPGDLIFFCWDGDDSSWDHVGFVKEVSDDSVTTIEGNAENQVVIRSYDVNDPVIRAYGVPNYAPKSIDESTISTKIDYLNNHISFFTTTGSACGTHESGHSCDKCYNVNVIASQWFRNIFGSVSADNFPATYSGTTAGYPRGWSCYGFAAFAEWYIFADSNTERITTSRVGTYSFNYANMSSQARIGDLLRLGGSHSAIFISADSSGIYVLDCNWGYNTYGQCYVQKHTINYSNYSSVTISRCTKSSVNPVTPTPDYPIEEGSWSYIVTGSLGVNVRSGPSTDYGVLTAIPRNTQITITAKSSNWGRVTYNGTTGWVCLDYCEIVGNDPDPGNSEQGTWTYVVTGSLGSNVRSGPGTGYDVLTAIPRGTTITITEIFSNWGKTTYNNITGWVCLDYCELVGGTGPNPDPQVTWTYQVTGDQGLNVRSGPGTNYSVITAIPRWTMITITEIQGNWGLTTYNGYTGWVCLDYAELISYNCPSFTVRFINYDGSVLKSETVQYGSSATPPSNPSRTGYTFTGWSGNYTSVTSNEDVYAQFSINVYTVVFQDWNGTVLSTQQIYYGDSAVAPSNPTRVGYTFDDWDRDFSYITANTVVTATYIINSYMVTFVDYDGTVLKSQTVHYGDNATPPSNPSRAGYTFSGWSGSYSNVTSDRTITATYTINQYTVTWKNYDGTTLETDTNVPYGTTPTYNGATPTKPATAQYTFTFNGWSPAVAPVTGNVTYTAQFTSVENKYTVTWKNYDGTTLETDTNVPYGTTPTYNGATPTKPATAQYTFTFNGWSPAVAPVAGNVTYTAQFTSAVNKYTVTFKDWDGTVLKTQQVDYGTAATAPADPEREGYTFIGWDKDFSNIIADLIVTAQYEQNTVPPENAVSFTLGEVNAVPGSDVSVDFCIDGEFEASALTVYINYDAEKLSVVSTTKGNVWMDMLELDGNVMCNTSVTGSVRFMAILPTDYFTSSGTIFTIKFHVNDDVELGTDIPIELDVREFFVSPIGGTDTPIPFTESDGMIHVSYLLGDVNGDGEINASDVILVMRYGLDIIELDPVQLAAADVNNDGVVNASDALTIMRMVLGVI